MQIKDNKNEIPLSHYKSVFASKDPSEMSFRSGVPFENGMFKVNLLGRPVEISYPDMEMRYADNGNPLRPNATILLARLIIEGSIIPAGGKMNSYAEMPWGNVYLAQFTGRCIMRLAFGFANFPEKFAAACESVGGKSVKGGDAAYDIEQACIGEMKAHIDPEQFGKAVDLCRRHGVAQR